MEQKKLIDPQTNKVQISTYRNVRSFAFIAKIYMKKFEEIEFHAVGEAISISVQVADLLEKFSYAKITKIQTLAVKANSKEGETADKEAKKNERKKIKMVIKLQRAADFMEKVKNIN